VKLCDKAYREAFLVGMKACVNRRSARRSSGCEPSGSNADATQQRLHNGRGRWSRRRPGSVRGRHDIGVCKGGGLCQRERGGMEDRHARRSIGNSNKYGRPR
jgi:hypothetical protein